MSVMNHGTPPSMKFVVAPKSFSDQDIWRQAVSKSKDFRLLSLQESPEAFASTYERKAAFTNEVWEARLANPQATTVVALADTSKFRCDDDHTLVRALVDREWLATTVLVREGHNSVAGAKPTSAESDASEARLNEQQSSRVLSKMTFNLNGVYVAPGHRGMGVGQRILRRALEIGQKVANAEGVSELLFRVRVDSENLAAFRAYAKAGFKEVSRKSMMMPKKVKVDGILLPPRTATIIVMEHIRAY